MADVGLAALVILTGVAVQAGEIQPDGLASLPEADVVILGEIHDNALHHLNQASAIVALQPAAVVFEMLTPAQAEIARSGAVSGAALGAALDWNGSGWPDFSMYQPIFDAVGEAQIYGMAVARERVSAAFSDGAAAAFGEGAARYGLDQPLSNTEQSAREAMQATAHCDALPPDMLPGMVAAQRLRDAAFADTVLTALIETGGPVAVITGSGHARNDWGMPVALRHAAPDVTVLSIGQLEVSEDAEDDLPFDLWLITEAAERADPCAAFQNRDNDG